MDTYDEKYMALLMSQDPGLPRPNPTCAYWQHIPHSLSEVQSHALPASINVAIIGSGITGVSLAKNILESSTSQRVTVFEARTLCSGATGRNGGQLAINAAESYLQLKESFGTEMAGKIIEFNLKTLDRLREVAEEIGVIEYAELTAVEKIRSFKDASVWKGVKDGVEALQADHPSLATLYRLLDPTACEKEYGLFNVEGGVVHPAGTVWPYRLVTKIFENLLDRFPSRLAIETNTPITGIEYDIDGSKDFPYLLKTPRGVTRAAKIAHCTNAYSSHLLPGLRGVIYPLKGTMTVQDLTDNLSSGLIHSKRSNNGSKNSWAIHYTPFEDVQEESVADGLIYGMQNVNTGAFFFGGEKARMADMISANDADLSPSSVKFLRESLLSLFGEDPNSIENSKLISSWSGIMGFTSDGMPLVGRLPRSMTQREGQGEWICAGFNGYGMPIAWLSSENLGQIILGSSAHSYVPEPYLLSEERIRERLFVKESVRRLVSL